MESIIITSKWIGYIYNGIFGILVYILCESVCLLHLRNFCDSQSKLNKILKHINWMMKQPSRIPSPRKSMKLKLLWNMWYIDSALLTQLLLLQQWKRYGSCVRSQFKHTSYNIFLCISKRMCTYRKWFISVKLDLHDWVTDDDDNYDKRTRAIISHIYKRRGREWEMVE